MIRILTRLRPALPVILRLVLGGTLLLAGMAKISEPALFAQTVRAYKILPILLINPFAIAIPWVEVVAGILLLLGLWTRSSALVLLLLLLSFAAALVVNLFRGADFACGCFGFDGSSGSLSRALVLDSLLIVLSALLIRASETRLSLDRVLSRF